MKKIILFIGIFYGWHIYAQNCRVIPAALQSVYKGDCKKDKADGKGTAIGEDQYAGDFKNGYPDGKGKYNWKNGDWYEGNWKKGLREGPGTLHFAGSNSKDSVITGFWKKDKYIGSHEKPYLVHSKTLTINSADVVYYNESSLNEIRISIESVSGGASTIKGLIPKIQITDISILAGQYSDIMENNSSPKIFVSTLKRVEFPFRASITMGADIIDIEFFEKGSYSLYIKINR